ncbi:MAG TPA: YdeI/OmpD-associated family protein [Vicinamibacterales bacterium]|nr:YdeI/OmpD-associated family protein [Vicinamibacterales bacterium]
MGRTTTNLIHLDVRTREDWRRWLEQHHASSPGIWLVRHKTHTGIPSLPYEDLVREALCFGWIDSLVRRLDDSRYAIKVTPRRPASKWSDLNRTRWKALRRAGLLAAPGIAAAPTAHRYAPKPAIPEFPPYIRKAFKAVPQAWTFFQTLPARNRRDFIVWIHTARRPETRERRIRESVARLAAGRMLGLK